MLFRSEGNPWYSDFNSQFIGKLDLKTGKAREWAVPVHRPVPIAQGGLQIAHDKQGRVYYGNMSQMQVVRFDPKTETFLSFPSDKSGANVRQMAGRPGEAWGGESGTNRIVAIDKPQA